MNTPEIEKLLHAAPRPEAPVSLKQSLVAGVQFPPPSSRTTPAALVSRSWFRRWWPALAPAGVSLACALAFKAQQAEIREVKQNLTVLAEAAAVPAPADSALTPKAVNSSSRETTEAEEIARLKNVSARLATEIARLEQVQAENSGLRAQLAAPAPGALSPQEAGALANARERAMRIQCTNNLKQLGLSVRTWALDNGNMTPPNILCMTNEMSTPKILVCPADISRQPASSWSGWSLANCSYEYLAPGVPDSEDPNRVLFRCVLHGNIGLMDGSVQYIGTDHPERLVQRDGKLFLKMQDASPGPQ